MFEYPYQYKHKTQRIKNKRVTNGQQGRHRHMLKLLLRSSLIPKSKLRTCLTSHHINATQRFLAKQRNFQKRGNATSMNRKLERRFRENRSGRISLWGRGRMISRFHASDHNDDDSSDKIIIITNDDNSTTQKSLASHYHNHQYHHHIIIYQ